MIKEEIKPFLDEYGLVHPSPPATHGPSQNGVRFTSEYYLTLLQLGILTPEDEKQFAETMKHCELEAGLYARHPKDLSQQAPDDYVALAYAAQMIAPKIAKDIWDYGKLNFWIYRTSPQKTAKTYASAFFARMPQVICHFYFCADKDPSFFLKIGWCLAVLLACRAKRGDQDGFMLSWHLVKAARGKSILCDIVGSLWIKQQKKVFPEGLGKCLEEYFGHPHPVAKWFVT